jgi:hypothetical protein
MKDQTNPTLVEEIRVTQQCNIPFSIGKYRDEMYCDVVGMNAYSLIFRRPLQYDVDAKHVG